MRSRTVGRRRLRTAKTPPPSALGRKGGLKGGKARAAKMSAEQRAEIARNAAKARLGLRTTPAMAAKVTERLWEMSDVVDVLEAWETSNGKEL